MDGQMLALFVCESLSACVFSQDLVFLAPVEITSTYGMIIARLYGAIHRTSFEMLQMFCQSGF
jgi:hypothetical protein